MKSKIVYVPLVTISLMTIFVNPWTSPDPINQPKLLVGLLGFSTLIPLLIKSLILGKEVIGRKFLFTIFVIFVCIMFSTIINNGEIWEKLWGVFGRSTGSLAYLIILLSFLCGFVWHSYLNADLILTWIIRTGYLVSFYAILQIAELDPFTWDSRGQVGFSTLGNINYVSAFLGMTSCAMLTYVISTDKSVTSRIWFALICLTNFSIFLISGSLQGFLVVFTGVSSLILIISKQGMSGSIKWPVLGISYLVLWIITFLGLAGFPPLGGFIKQDTMVFRADYWKAGLKMIMDSPLLGKGPDSYGMYYREFRDYAATYRTEPERTSNSAHSVLIDFGVSYGVIAALGILLIIFIIYRQVIKSLDVLSGSGNSIDTSYKALIAISGGFLSTLMFSISQIAIMSWGLLILGWLAQRSIQLTSQSAKDSKLSFSRNSKPGKVPNGKSKYLEFVSIFIAFMLSTSLLVAPRFTAEREFKKAVTKPDIEFLERESANPYAPIGYGYLALDTVISLNLLEPSLVIARNLVARNPREYVAWTIISRHPDSTSAERSFANQRLRELDPLNEENP